MENSTFVPFLSPSHRALELNLRLKPPFFVFEVEGSPKNQNHYFPIRSIRERRRTTNIQHHPSGKMSVNSKLWLLRILPVFMG